MASSRQLYKKRKTGDAVTASSITIPEKLSPTVKSYIDSGVSAHLLACQKCNNVADNLTVIKTEAKDGFRALKMNCGKAACGRRNWFVCCQCKMRWSRIHYLTNHGKNYHPETTVDDNSNLPQKREAAIFEDDMTLILKDEGMDQEEHDDLWEQGSPTKDLSMVPEVAGGGLWSSEYPSRPESKTNSHQWLELLLKDQKVASYKEVEKSFEGLEHMQDFWCLENNTEAGSAGKGFQYLVARAFHGDVGHLPGNLPSFEEAKFHMDGFVLYVHLKSEKLRKRHSVYTQSILRANDIGILKTTHLPMYDDMHKYYGIGTAKPTKTSLWASLPIPPCELV